MSTKGTECNESSCRDYNVKRDDYLEWKDYFMAVAFLSAQRSKDPSTQVGACIVNDENKIVGIGYNGMPNGCNDDELPWKRDSEDWLDTKYPYGIKCVIYFSDKHREKKAMIASRRMLDLAGIPYNQHKPKKSVIEINFGVIDKRATEKKNVHD